MRLVSLLFGDKMLQVLNSIDYSILANTTTTELNPLNAEHWIHNQLLTMMLYYILTLNMLR